MTYTTTDPPVTAPDVSSQEGLRAHAEATGEGVPWGWVMKVGSDLRAYSVESDVGYNAREHTDMSAGGLATWVAGQYEQATRGRCRLVGCALSLPSPVAVGQEDALVELLRDGLPGLGWPPSWLWLNTVGYSDRGEPPDPSVSLQIHGVARWTEAEGREYQSTVTTLVADDDTQWVPRITAVARKLGLGLRTV